MAKPRTSPLTDVVIKARQRYVDILDRVAASPYASVPYMKQRMDSRTRDQRLLRMQPEDLMNLDPLEAAQSAARIRQLQARSLAKPQDPSEAEFE